MRKYLPTLVAMLLALALPQGVSAAESEADQAITKLREGLVDSFNQGDLERLLTHLDTNAVVTWQNGEVCEGTSSVRAYYDRMMKGDHPVVTKVTADPKVLGRHIQGDWAVSWGNLNDKFVLADGRGLPLNSRFTATVIKRGDRWVVSAFHVSVNAFDNPILTLAIRKSLMIAGIGGLVFGAVAGAGIMRMSRRRNSAA